MGLKELPAGWENRIVADRRPMNPRVAPVFSLPVDAMIAPKPSKHRNKKTVVDGMTFDSEKEATRYQELKLLERVGAIRDLELQPKVDCYGANGERVCGYRGDFRYFSLELGRTVLEDTKSDWTRRLPVYRIKMKLLRAQGITVTEV